MHSPNTAFHPPSGYAFTQVEFTLLFIEFHGADESSFCAKRGRKIQAGGRKIQAFRKENPSQGKENPSSFHPRIAPFQRVAPAPQAISAVSAEVRSYRGCAIGARAPGSQSGGVKAK